MKRFILLIARLYPRSWREEFGEEFDAVLDDVKPSWRVFANILGGAIMMQIATGTNWLKLAAATAVVGAIAALGMSYRVAPRYVSSAAISVTPQPDPVRPVSPQVLKERAAEHVAEMEAEILSRWRLFQIVRSLDLYQAERKREPPEDVIEQMRHDLRIQARSSEDDGATVVSISFDYPDQVKAQAAVRELAARFAEVDLNSNRTIQDAYRGFWRDMAADRNAEPAPPPPVGDVARIIDAADQPMESPGPNRLVYLTWGLGVGLLLGLVAAFSIRWPRSARQLAGFAMAGCIVAGAASFLIPNRFTSTAVMMIDPARITEDPLAPLPAVTPATEFLRQFEPEVLSFQSLSEIIQDHRLNLYSDERATKSMEEVVRNMLANDLRIAALDPVSGSKGPVSAFRISFSYDDRYKAQQAVQAVMNAFDLLYQEKGKAVADASQSVKIRQILQRKGGEVLDVLDVASLPGKPVSPNRLMIALGGLVLGLMLGAIRLWFRQPRGPAAAAVQFAQGLSA